MYPNPTNGDFTLIQKGNATFDNVQMTIYTMRGDRILSRELNGQKSYSFSAADYASGFYFIKLVAKDHVETIKLIKTN